MNNVISGFKLALLCLILLLTTTTSHARGIYQTNDAFLAEVFNGTVPQSDVVWMKGNVRQTVADILGHPYAGLRIRYWRVGQRSAWILEEIGKEEPITFGVVINGDRVEQVKVLAYRESRGGEVKYPAFTQQFQNVGLVDNRLDKHIDGITGATLSVRAMTNVVRLALYLDSSISQS
ncbi:MAG: FMN-binding protein [Pseudomonadota bacterium]|uniref:FMN-binding protein n=1 Tax=Methylophaga aminisulfidivorans TaxID=230105 RepID=UPI0024E2544B|nr:FMN-binding protein [Methylophaga aminisulfidivorans]MEC9412344.1 FMN-binding protein [Pseudomonadota bacterium]